MYDYHFIEKSNQPKVIEIEDGVKIHVDTDNNIVIEGHNGIKFKCPGDIEFEAENINMHAKSMITSVDGDVYVGSSTHIVHQAPRIDLNPKVLTTGYYGNIKKKVLDLFDFSDQKQSSFECREIKDDNG